MGNCESNNQAADVASSIIHSNTKQVQKIKKNLNFPYHVMISYCLDNKELCHLLADRLIGDNFSIWIDKGQKKGDVYYSFADAIDNCDSILLCISEAYFNNTNCQREARYAADRKLPIIPIIVSTNYKPEKWLSAIIGGNICYKIEDASLSFDETYDKIKEEVLKNTLSMKPVKIEYRNLPTAEEEKVRRLAYDKKFRLQVEKHKDKIVKMKQEINKILNEKDDIQKDTVAILNRWNYKYPDITWLNFPPFSSTGDINDAKFELPFDIKNPKLLERPPSSLDTSLPNGDIAWRTIDSCIGDSVNSDYVIEDRKMLDTNLEIEKKRREELSSYFGAPKDCFCIFAARMKQNAIDFENFIIKTNSS